MTAQQKLRALMRAQAYHKEIILFVSQPSRILEIRQRNRDIDNAIGNRVWEKFYDDNVDWLSEFAE